MVNISTLWRIDDAMQDCSMVMSLWSDGAVFGWRSCCREVHKWGSRGTNYKLRCDLQLIEVKRVNFAADFGAGPRQVTLWPRDRRPEYYVCVGEARLRLRRSCCYLQFSYWRRYRVAVSPWQRRRESRREAGLLHAAATRPCNNI